MKGRGDGRGFGLFLASVASLDWPAWVARLAWQAKPAWPTKPEGDKDYGGEGGEAGGSDGSGQAGLAGLAGRPGWPGWPGLAWLTKQSGGRSMAERWVGREENVNHES